jgi:hypothetical protein
MIVWFVGKSHCFDVTKDGTYLTSLYRSSELDLVQRAVAMVWSIATLTSFLEPLAVLDHPLLALLDSFVQVDGFGCPAFA